MGDSSLSQKTHPTWGQLQHEVHQELRWTFPAHSASWMNGCSSCSLRSLLKALGAYLLHIRMWGCNYSYQVKDGEHNSFFFFSLPSPLCQHEATGLPGFATERLGICCTVLASQSSVSYPSSFPQCFLRKHRAEICQEHEVTYVLNSFICFAK